MGAKRTFSKRKYLPGDFKTSQLFIQKSCEQQSRCLQHQPKNRPSAAQLLDFPRVKLALKEGEIIKLGGQLAWYKKLAAQRKTTLLDERMQMANEKKLQLQGLLRAQQDLDTQRQIADRFRDELHRVKRELGRAASFPKKTPIPDSCLDSDLIAHTDSLLRFFQLWKPEPSQLKNK
jgi:hypothetical protein